MNYFLASFADLTIAFVNFPHPLFEMILNATTGYFELDKADAARTHMQIAYCESNSNAPVRAIYERFYDVDSNSIFVDLSWSDVENVFYVQMADVTYVYVQMLVRVLRALVAAQLYCNDFVFVHCAAVGIGDTCLGIIGPKRQGKTTLLLNCMANSDLRPMTNDKLAIRRDLEPWTAIGFPIRAGIRDGTLTEFPELNYKLEKYRSCSILDDKAVRISMHELAEIYGRTVLSKASVKAFIIPEPAKNKSHAEIRRLTVAEAALIVEQNILRSIDEVEPLQAAVKNFFPNNPHRVIDTSFIPVYRLSYSSASAKEAVLTLKNLLK